MPPDAGSLGTCNETFPTEHLPTLMLNAPGRTPHRGPILDESIPKRDGHTGKRSESNGKRPSSLEESSNVHKKRKFSQMKDSGDTYNVIHTSPAIKEEPGLPIDDSPNSSGSTSPGAFSVKQKLSTGKVLQGYSNANGNSGVTIFGPSPRLDDFSGMVEEEERDWLGNSLLKASNVENRTSSSGLTELSMWNISESEMHTTEMEEETSDDESVVSVLSLGKERQEKVKSERSSRGPETINREESNDPPSRRDTVQDQNHIASVGPSVSGVVGHERMEQGTPHRTISHNLDDQIRDAFNALSGDGVNEVDRINGRDDQTTVRGEPRQRAPPKTQVSARDISRSWKTANPADKMLMKMKLRGCGWKEIRKAWEELTGEQPAPSTLPNRYNRIKDNLTRLRSGDVRVLPFIFLFSLFVLWSFCTTFWSQSLYGLLHWGRRIGSTYVLRNSYE